MIRISRYLSFVLRHRPDAAGLNLDPEGWVEVDALLAGCTRHGLVFTREELDEVVRTDDKQRYAFADDGRRLRASQGHSVPVELGLATVTPPLTLYHGTVERSVAAILREGLLPRGRQHVHLSGDIATARRVGKRRGAPVVLSVAAERMHAAGHEFLRAANGVWLTGHVPPAYLAPLGADEVVAVTLWRPVGPAELALIEASGWRAFPPRLPGQPIFYPVLNPEYAAQIAGTWNVQDSGAGFVVRFAVEAAFADRYPIRVVGAAAVARELWVPAADLDAFNAHLVGPIEVVAGFP
jgi:putative RNA 2'-phosphotransferase